MLAYDEPWCKGQGERECRPPSRRGGQGLVARISSLLPEAERWVLVHEQCSICTHPSIPADVSSDDIV